MYHSSTEDKLVSLAEYASYNEEKPEVYLLCLRRDHRQDLLLPVMENAVRHGGLRGTWMDDSIDELCVKMLAKYNDKEFKSIADADPRSGQRGREGRDQKAE